jgi:hypothetical protein
MVCAPTSPNRIALVFWVTLLFLNLSATSALARPIERLTSESSAVDSQAPPIARKAAADTFWFGGTHWDAAQVRWEANVSTSRTNRWTFDSGVDGSWEGWTARDLTLVPLPTVPVGNPDNADFRWTNKTLYTLYGTPGTNLFPTATPPDTGGIWCSKYEVEADELCYAAGQGYGTNWEHEARKTFSYAGTGGVRLTYKYFNNTERSFDWTFLYLEFDGIREPGPRGLHTFTLGSPGSKRTKTLTIAAASIPPGTSEVAAVFRFMSDEGWSDEDGVGFTTMWGAFCCYNFKYEDLGTPANNDEDTFEEGPEAWQFFQKPPVGDFVAVSNVAELPPPETACPCTGDVIAGNVMTLFDQSAGPGEPLHPPEQEAAAVSPYIDLAEAGLADRPIRLVVGDAYMWLPVDNAVYYGVQLRQYPVLCEETGQWIEDEVAYPYVYSVSEPTCFDDALFRDFSWLTPTVEYCRIELEVIELCATSTQCTTPGGNASPWWDNIALAVTGTPGLPVLRQTELAAYLQDVFASDGTLSPRATCLLRPSGPNAVDDVDISISCSSDNTEVRLHFKYTAGPGTSPASAFFERYPLQNAWYDARCDTSGGKWIAEYHESSPYFAGEGMPANDILPDGVFTPGSHFECYWSAHQTGGAEDVFPDVPSGAEPLHADLLPGMAVAAGGDTVWPCMLYINGESPEPFTAASPYHTVEAAINAALGAPGRFDRFDLLTPGMTNNTGFERFMTDPQILGYQAIVGIYGPYQSNLIEERDASQLAFWLSTGTAGANGTRQFLYLSGDGLAMDMQGAYEPNALALLNNTFGVLTTCGAYAVAGCPTGSAADTSFCVRLSAASGAEPGFPFTGEPYMASGNGCRGQRRFSVIDVNPAVPTARPNLDYLDQDGTKGTTHYASVTNSRTGTAEGNYRTVFDAMSLSRLRRPSGPTCSDDTLAVLDRLNEVFTWCLQDAGLRYPCGETTVNVPEPEPTGAPKVPSLTVAPNPFHPAVTLRYAVAAPGRVTLRIFDVRGALSATLVEEVKAPGRYEAIWRGRAASGVYWAKFAVGGKQITRQLVLLK